MANPIYQQGEELLLNQFGSKYLGVAAHTNVNSNEFIVQEDAVISVLTGGDSSTAANNVDYKASMSLSGVTLKQGALIVAPQGESFQSMTIDSGTIMAYNSVLGGTKPGAAQLLLDLYPDAAVAYSLRYLSNAYIGSPVVRVRRSSDNAELDFIPSEITDGTLTTFTGAGNGFVTTWYDQSGNGSNATQVVSSGVALEVNGKPTPYFDQTASNSMNFADETIGSSFFVKEGLITSGYAFLGNTGNVSLIGDRSTTAISIRTISLLTFPVVSNVGAGTPKLFTFINPTNAWNVHFNGVASSSNPIATVSTVTVNTLMNRQGAFFHDGFINDVVIYSTDQTANRVGIEDNINNFYSIY